MFGRTMTRRVFRRRLLWLGAGLVTLGLAGGAAFAYWGGSGSGGGGGSLITPVAVTLIPTTPDTELYPGGTPSVALTVSNPNVTSAHISALSLDTTQGTGGFAVDGSHSGCPLTALSYTTQSNGSAGWTVPGKTGGVNGALAITLPNALAMSVSAPNACQGAAFTVYLTTS